MTSAVTGRHFGPSPHQCRESPVSNIISGDDVTFSSRSRGGVESVSISARTYGRRRVGLSKRDPSEIEEDKNCYRKIGRAALAPCAYYLYFWAAR